MTAAGSSFDAAEFVRARLADSRGPGLGSTVNVADPRVSTEGRIAYVASTLRDIDGSSRTHVVIHGHGRVRDGDVDQSSPRWSAAGRLAYLEAAGPGGVMRPRIDGVDRVPPDLDGTVEELHWLDEDRLLLLVAGHGAQVAGARGSGTIAAREAAAGPWVLKSRDSDRRWLTVWDARDGSCVRPPLAVNCWEAWPVDPEHALAVVSESCSESAWYYATLALVDLTTGVHSTLYESERQIGLPRAFGATLSVVECVSSDRTLIAGELMVSHGGTGFAHVPTAAVDVTDVSWLSESEVIIAGVRGLDSVALGVKAGQMTTLFEGRSLAGSPSVAAIAGQPVVAVVETLTAPPALVTLPRAEAALVETDHPGRAVATAHLGGIIDLRYPAADGLDIEALLIHPPGPPPWPVVVHVHGGPVVSWRERFGMANPTVQMLTELGFAFFCPNIRGSSGRGLEFAGQVYRDMGGADLGDVRAGITHIIEAGLADPDRLASLGGSYGGYLSCALAVHEPRLRTAVGLAPVSDWFSQHFTTNIPAWDDLFLDGDWQGRGGLYAERSPALLCTPESAPMLLCTGLRDRCTPPGQALEMYEALRLQGVEAELVVYPDSAHGLTQADGVDELIRIVEWIVGHCPPR